MARIACFLSDLTAEARLDSFDDRRSAKSHKVRSRFGRSVAATGRKNNAFDIMTNGYERTAFNIAPDAVDRAEEIVASLSDEYLQWLSADIDEIENSLPKAYKNPQRVDQLRRKANDIRGQGGSFGFPLIPRLADGLYLVMVSQDGPLSRGGADLTRGLFALPRCGLLSKGGRRASGTRRRAKPPITQFLKSKFVMTGRDAEYH